MAWMKKNWGWILVCILAVLPLVNLYSLVEFNFSNPNYDLLLFDDYELSEEVAERIGWDVIPGMKYALHTTGEWGIRWMIAVLLISPARIVFGIKSNLYVRQAMGITSGVYVILHSLLFLYSEGFVELFSELNLILATIASLIVIPLTITSNRRFMKMMKKRWKKMHRLVFWAASLSILHVVLLKQGWELYAVLFILGLVVRYKPIRKRIEARSFKLAPVRA